MLLASACARPAYIAERTRVYTSENGVEVAVVDVTDGERDTTLIKVTGTRHIAGKRSRLEGLVLAYDTEVVARRWRGSPVSPGPFDSILHSYLATAGTSKCALTCGERVVQLKPVELQPKREALAGVRHGPPPARRKPYALARDPHGIYYYVDNGPEQQSKRYKVYRGPKGALVELKMKNIVSDSHGDVFATDKGSLKLLLQKTKTLWVDGKQTSELISLPLEDNWNVIYNQLGLYTGLPLGTPCDEL